MEAMGYKLLINECVRIERAGAAIYLAGIDDAHFYRLYQVPLIRTHEPSRVVRST
jgi:uncharacterized protein